jgi:CubicO group peptidase (beta-lactamase class C family)
MGANMKAFGHTGTGGAFAWCDRDRNLSFAYYTNFQREGPGMVPRGAAQRSESRRAAANGRTGSSERIAHR